MGLIEKEVILEGTGKSKQEAFSNAMSSLQKQLSARENEYIIRIEPLEVEIIDGKEYISYEKFMFFFLKRKISKFVVSVRVKVQCFTVLDDFQYKEIQVKNKLIGINNNV